MYANPVAIVLSVLACFVASGVWYSVFGARLAALSPAYAEGAGRPAAATVAVELARSTTLALFLAALISLTGVSSTLGGVGLAVVLWVGVPAVVLSGAVFHERTPVLLAGIHLGDWLIKLLILGGVLATWA